MSTMFPHIAQPLNLRHKTLRNRINFGAHTANMSENGLPAERHLGYYTERALGGAAMIVVEPIPVHATGVLTRGNFHHSDDAIIPGFRKITDACHELGSVMIHQLYHIGQHGDADNSFMPNWSPSGLPSYHDSNGSHQMTDAQIEELIDSFVRAANRAYKAGFDGIELFAAYHAVIDQFWTPWSNRRDDRWGGSFTNRMRFSTCIAERIRSVCGQDFIIGMAVSMDEDIEVSLNIESMQEIITYHDQRGLIDYVTCGTGSYFDFYKLIPTVFYAENLGAGYAEKLKLVTKHAKVQAESHIRTPENANIVIGQGQADMVSIVRGQIADPHLVNKALNDNPEEIRSCISCNQMCWGRRNRDYWISCLINPSAGREFEWGGDRFIPTNKPRRILIVGGGPAGLEAARVAAERGHNVTLVEAGPKLGGQFRLAAIQPRRGQIADLINWYERQLQKLQVNVRLNTYFEASEISAFGADSIVLATGSLPSGTGFQRALPQLDSIPGVDKENVFSVEDILNRSARPGKHIILLDDNGHWQGGGTALHLAEQKHKVTIITGWPTVAFELARSHSDWPLRRALKKLGVSWKTETAITEWHGNAATILDLANNEKSYIKADCLVLATTNISTNELSRELHREDNIHSIGDALAPRYANMAIYEGRKVALSL